jgi:hypothetical protein
VPATEVERFKNLLEQRTDLTAAESRSATGARDQPTDKLRLARPENAAASAFKVLEIVVVPAP